MFKQFWDEKRHIVEATGIVVALGALFLTIPLPNNNPQARQALFYLQFVWLLLISGALSVLGWNATQLVYDIEQRIEQEHGLLIEGTLSALTLVMTAGLMVAIWVYMLAIYGAQARAIFRVLYQTTIVSLLFSGYVFMQWRIESRLRASGAGRMLAQLSLFAAFLMVAIATKNLSELHTPWYNLARADLTIFVMVSGLGAIVTLVTYRRRVRRKIQARQTNNSSTSAKPGVQPGNVVQQTSDPDSTRHSA